MPAPALQAAGAAVAGRVARAARARRGGDRAACAADADRRPARAGVLDRRRLCRRSPAAAALSRRVSCPCSTRPHASTRSTPTCSHPSPSRSRRSARAQAGGRSTGAGCVGLMQMCVGGVGGDSWSATKYAYRKGQRPPRYSFMTARHPDVLDSFDNVMAAAVHLRGKVGGRPIANLDGVAYQALCGYYGACTDGIAGNYAADVLERARSWQREAGSTSASQPVLGQTGPLAWPVRGPVTSPFCERRAWEACHPGIDIGVPSGTPILAAAAGRVSVVAAVRQLGRLRQLHLPSTHQLADHLLRTPGAVSGPSRRDRRPRATDRTLRLHRALLRLAPALRGPPRRPGRLPCPLPRRADRLDVRRGVAGPMTHGISLPAACDRARRGDHRLPGPVCPRPRPVHVTAGRQAISYARRRRPKPGHPDRFPAAPRARRLRPRPPPERSRRAGSTGTGARRPASSERSPATRRRPRAAAACKRDSARIDATLARDKPGSRGRVAAIDLKPARRGRGHRRHARADLHRRTRRPRRPALPRLPHPPRARPEGWPVSAWEPQP